MKGSFVAKKKDMELKKHIWSLFGRLPFIFSHLGLFISSTNFLKILQ